MKRAWTVILRTETNDRMKQTAREGVRKVKGRVGSYVGARGKRLKTTTVSRSKDEKEECLAAP